MKTALATISFIIGIELLYLAYRLIFRKEFRAPLYTSLGIIALLCAPWTIGYGVMYSTSNKEIAFLAYHFSAFGWTLGLSCWYLFFYELDKYISGTPRKISAHIISWIVGSIFYIISLSGVLYAEDLKYNVWWGWEEQVKTNSVWVILYIGVLIIALLISVIRIRHTLRFINSKKQMRLLKLIGVSFAVIAVPTIIINLIIPFFDITLIPPIGHLLISTIALVIGRLVILYRALDINPTIAASQILFEVSDYVFLTGLEGSIRKISNSALSILNLDQSLIINSNISEFTHGLNTGGLREKAESSGVTFKIDLISKNNIVIPVRCKVTLVMDTYDDPIGYLLVMTDLRDMIAIEDLENVVEKRTSEIAEKNRKLSDEIAERKKIERILISIEEKQRAMISNISDVIAVMDIEGKIIFNSPNLEKLFGWLPDDVIGKRAFDFIHPDDIKTAEFLFQETILNPESTNILEFRLKCKNGRYQVVHLTALNKIHDPHINGILLNYYDVTDRVEAEAERQLRAERTQKQQDALLKIANDESIKQGDKESSFKLITEIGANTLNVERVSIWFFDKAEKELICADWYDKYKGIHEIIPAVNLAHFPGYLKRLKDGLTIDIKDVEQDERAREFRDTYLIPSGITSLLDAGIRMSGRLIGVLSFTHTGPARNWGDEETTFALQLADLVTQAVLYGERKAMIDKLRLFAYTIRSVSENISITDMHDKLIFVNDSFCKTYGYHESELLGNTVEMLRAKKNIISQVNKILPKTIDGGWEGELWNKKKDGTEFLIHLSTSIIKDEEDKPVALVGIATDITARKKEEEKIFTLLRFQSEMLDTAAMWINTLDVKGNITFWNKAAEKISGFSKEEVLNSNLIWGELYPDPEYRKFVYTEVEKIIFENAKVENFQTTIRRKDGENRMISWYSNNLIDESGVIAGSIAIGIDITERNRAEEALKLSEQKMRLHFEQTPLGVIEWDSNYCVVSWNYSAELIFGYSALEARGKHASFIIPSNIREEMNITLSNLLDQKSSSRRSNENITKNGNLILCEWYNTALTAGNGEVIGITSLVMDITERQIAAEEQNRLLDELKRSRAKIEDEAIKLAILNEQLTESEQKLKELNASKDKFFSIIAHDLKSPFLSLLGYSEILSNEFDNLSEDEKRESILGIYDLSNNSYKLLENLLQWSRIQIGKVDFYPEPFNLHYELSPAILLLSQTAKNKNIKIENLIERHTFVNADKNMLNTIIRNLISNSIKFCHKGGRIIISSRDDIKFIEISVKDNGVGMDKYQLENLFSIDKNLTTKGTANETGTGLGLLLCKEMVEKHGGAITAQSKQGKGSEFKFTIPKK